MSTQVKKATPLPQYRILGTIKGNPHQVIFDVPLQEDADRAVRLLNMEMKRRLEARAEEEDDYEEGEEEEESEDEEEDLEEESAELDSEEEEEPTTSDEEFIEQEDEE